MITKIATFIAITAFALIGAVAQAKVNDFSNGQNGVTGQMLLHSIDQTPSLFGCDVGSFSHPASSSADSAINSALNSALNGNVPDIFAGNFNILDDDSIADSCAVPIPNPEQFRNVAAR